MYSRRVSQMELFADNLFDQEGNEVESISSPEVKVKVGDRVITLKIKQGGYQLGEFTVGSRVELTVSEKNGFSKEKPMFKVDLW